MGARLGPLEVHWEESLMSQMVFPPLENGVGMLLVYSAVSDGTLVVGLRSKVPKLMHSERSKKENIKVNEDGNECGNDGK